MLLSQFNVDLVSSFVLSSFLFLYSVLTSSVGQCVSSNVAPFVTTTTIIIIDKPPSQNKKQQHELYEVFFPLVYQYQKEEEASISMTSMTTTTTK